MCAEVIFADLKSKQSFLVDVYNFFILVFEQ